MLMDATVASGAAAMMAIRVLLDHDVPEDNIFLCSLLMAVSGVHSIAYAFPKVKVVTTQVDPEVNDKFYILPGIGIQLNKKNVLNIEKLNICFAIKAIMAIASLGQRPRSSSDVTKL